MCGLLISLYLFLIVVSIVVSGWYVVLVLFKNNGLDGVLNLFVIFLMVVIVLFLLSVILIFNNFSVLSIWWILLLLSRFLIIVVFLVSVVKSKIWFDKFFELGKVMLLLIFVIGLRCSCFI